MILLDQGLVLKMNEDIMKLFDDGYDIYEISELLDISVDLVDNIVCTEIAKETDSGDMSCL